MKNLLILFSALLLSACANHTSLSKPEQRKVILDMESSVLKEMYSKNPSLRAVVAESPGYAVFSNANINLILASFGSGYGVVTNRKSKAKTYMKMGEVGIGLGVGVKDFRILIVFDNQSAMNDFINSGWGFGGQADAAVKSNNKGGAVGGEKSISGFRVYQITKAGVALQATLKGTKFWKDDLLN